MSPIRKLLEEIHRRSIWQLLGLYVAGGWVLLEVVATFVEQLFLPGWVFPGALLLLAIGLPVLTVTATVQGGLRSRADGAPGLRGLLTWRRAIGGGVLALLLLGVGTTGWLAMRAMGIGPAATLVDSGELEELGSLLVADLRTATGDTALADVAAEALRIDLAQSPVLRVAGPQLVSQALGRMGRSRDARLDEPLAIELAVREGIAAVVTGELNSAGNGYVITAKVLAPGTGETLLSRRETARDTSGVLDAIDALSAGLRERIGEPLASVRADPPLERATTASLDALRLFTRATRMIDVEARNTEAIPMLEEAVRIDSTFALAWRKLAQAQANIGYPMSLRLGSLTRAFDLRDRLSPRERHLAAATYHMNVTRDNEEALAAYDAMLQLNPSDAYALTNGAQILLRLREYERAEEWAVASFASDPSNRFAYHNAINAQVSQGRFSSADSTLAAFATALPEIPDIRLDAAGLAWARGDYEQARIDFEAARDRSPNLPARHNSLRFVALVQGKPAEATRHLDDAIAAGLARGTTDRPRVGRATNEAYADAMVRRDPERGIQGIERALRDEPFDSVDGTFPPYITMAAVYGEAGQWQRASELLELARMRPGQNAISIAAIEVRIAIAQARYEEAIAVARRVEGGDCRTRCDLLAYAFDAAGQADSAIVYMERYVTVPKWSDWLVDGVTRPYFYERIAQLADEQGDLRKAAEYYARFAELWAEADEDLQPRVQAAHSRLEEILALLG
jgi:tetratricopeptide (TPR) repeat protein